MALSPQLANFKSSGVYRLEFDKSITTSFNTQTLRLVVGHSKKGPYNTPVLCQTAEEFNAVFGSIDLNLEKKGMFFHRSALAALGRGAILALNLANINENDTVSYQSLVTNGSKDSISANSGSKEYSSIFNVDKFWFPEDKEVIDSIGADSDRILNLVNIKQEPITVIVRKAQDVAQFDISAREWYGQGNVPAFLNDFDYLSDFMVDVFVFKGEFDAATLDTDPVYGAYFTSEGLIKAKLNEFANLRQVSLIAKYTGSVIPGFKDLEGRNLYIETAINQEARRTGLFCAINEDAVTDITGTKVDFIGHDYDDNQDYNLLSYKATQTVNDLSVVLPAAANNGGDAVITSLHTTSVANDTLHIENLDLTGTITTGQLFLSASTPGEYVQITHVEYTAGVFIVTANGAIASAYAGIDTTSAASSLPYFTLSASKFVHYFMTAGAVQGTYANIGGGQFTMTFDMTGHLSTAINFPIKKGNFVNAATAGRVARVKRVQETINGNVHTFTVTCDQPVADTWAYHFVLSFEEASSVYKTFVLGKASVGEKSISGVLSQLSGTNLFNALIDKDLIDYRYIVDTFGSLEDGGILNKRELSFLAHERQNASAILNAPMIKDFKASTNPSFKDANGAFQTEYIASGGNLDMNPSALYSLPSINDGANFAFYYGPGLVVRENGKDVIVPPAAYVSNNYVDKFFNALPWSIVAGPRRGVVSGANVVGVEYPFAKADRDILEPFGINPIVFQRGAGLTITGNKTAQQSIQSALSSAHVREVLIYIEEGLAKILKNYVFEFNTAQTRLEIKTLADSFMNSLKADGGVYDFKNVMDQTNNTNDVIDNNIGILDTFVEPVKGLEIVVQRTTVLNTGEIQTGNFS
jgi:hypothetical protein